MCPCYVKNQALADMEKGARDSPMWVSILQSKQHITLFASCQANNNLVLVVPDIDVKLSPLYNFYKPWALIDELVDGVWASKRLRMAIVLWRLRWNLLPSFNIFRR